MDKNLKIMLAQLNPIVGDLEKNSRIILETYKKASKNKVDILAFPEMFLSGYQIGGKTGTAQKSIYGSYSKKKN